MRISIVIPTYNRVDLIGATLESALSQTRPADEVIVADDGSNDGTDVVVAGFGDCVRHLKLPRRGHCAARNAGLRASSGEAICFLDSDDLLLPGTLEALEGALAADPEVAVAYCRAQIVEMDGSVREAVWGRTDHEGSVWPEMVRENFIRSPGCALVRRVRLEEIGLWDEDLKNNVDWDVWLRLAERWPFKRVGEALFQYRVHGGNLSGSNVRMASGALRVLDKHAARNRRDRRRMSVIADAYRVYSEFGFAEVLHEVSSRRTTATSAERDLILRSIRLHPLWTLTQTARFLLLRTKRSLPPTSHLGVVIFGLICLVFLTWMIRSEKTHEQ